MPIPLDNPKYRQIRNNGLCQLDIRKARLGDGGEYMCHAKNEHGEDWVSWIFVKLIYQFLIKGYCRNDCTRS